MEVNTERTITRTNPSGVSFELRNLKGKDQKIMTKQGTDGTESSRFNKMLAGALLKLGTLEGDQITEEVVKNCLSNDRKFMLVVLRQHSLNYEKEFKFAYEWPLQQGSKEKDLHNYSVNFDSKNFPVEPYQWMREKLAELKKDGDETVYDGHNIAYPVLYKSYEEMLADHKYRTFSLPGTDVKCRFTLQTGGIEAEYSHIPQNKQDANTTFEMHDCKYWDPDKDNSTKGKWIDMSTDEMDMLFVEVIRKTIKEHEGKVDTMLAIQHPKNQARETRVDLVGLLAFFFPSQAL